MYMTECTVIATRYIFLLLKNKLWINFVSFLTAGSSLQGTLSLTSRVAVVANTRVNECHIFTDRVKNIPDATTPWLNTSRKIHFFHSYERTSCVDYTSSSIIKNVGAYVLILIYVTTILKNLSFGNTLTLKMRIRDIDSVVVVYLTFVIIALDEQVKYTAISRKVVEKLCTRQSRRVVWDMFSTLFLTL